ncbi:hypothetical protein CYLTODRAFT_441868 [Cylindrobasidium torrendii FP15055 ss-10]|uniref:Uncharacterized protein n=1 Tax=Cylindrobasidium torrendii FP15055 ss-10 TaxID=1314674 RepID=A0A0D7BKK9_9AGAR|nr:hypothetical protein CYLTODRAFT_441868 [Cylindrobasidium torrendii FP15055 ss-10]
MPKDSSQTVTGSGTNSQGNHYCTRADTSSGNTGYHYSNTYVIFSRLVVALCLPAHCRVIPYRVSLAWLSHFEATPISAYLPFSLIDVSLGWKMVWNWKTDTPVQERELLLQQPQRLDLLQQWLGLLELYFAQWPVVQHLGEEVGVDEPYYYTIWMP